MLHSPADATRLIRVYAGWAGHNHYKLHLPTTCAAPRKLPWQRSKVPTPRLSAPAEDAMTCPLDVAQVRTGTASKQWTPAAPADYDTYPLSTCRSEHRVCRAAHAVSACCRTRLTT